ncbi:hypothetical protein [Bradyrhizobium sp. SYSU BS000235]|uniref:hypothetical protein n=1 Tax=Bradyrhizobium sp. SYSU BS000235 TaxID=3411332 RepID=UPI003C742A16
MPMPSMVAMMPAVMTMPTTMMVPTAVMVMTAPVHGRRQITRMLRCRGRCRVGERHRLSAVSRHRKCHQTSNNRKTKKLLETHLDRSPFKQRSRCRLGKEI